MRGARSLTAHGHLGIANQLEESIAFAEAAYALTLRFVVRLLHEDASLVRPV